MSALHSGDDLKVLLLLIAATPGQEESGTAVVFDCSLDPRLPLFTPPPRVILERADDRLLEFPAVSPNHLKT